MEKIKTLVCGDLHCKHDVFLKTIFKFKTEKYDKLIFLGDYVDDWDKPPEASINTVQNLIRLKQENPNSVILLLGNHDLSEWQGTDTFKCSGFNPLTHIQIRDIFADYEDLFQIAYSDGKHLYTHAGITTDWINEISFIDELYQPKSYNPDEWADYLNWIFRERENDYRANPLFKTLGQAGLARGGLHAPSPLWADKIELINSPLPLNQVVGHTPVEKIEKWDFNRPSNFTLTFCDTHSTTPYGENIGNGELLTVWN